MLSIRSHAASSFLVVALVGGSICRGQDALTASDKDLAAEAVLNFEARTANEMNGVLSRGSTKVTFASRSVDRSRVVLQVQIGDLVLDAEADYENDTRALNGHGHELSVEERSALAALSANLKGHLRPGDVQLSPHEDLLFQVVSFWAEAPVGGPLLDITAHAGDEIAGAFRSDTRSIAHAGSLDLSFASRLMTPTRVVLELHLGAHVLKADVDPQHKTAVLEGSGRALSAEQLQVLEDFGAEYERYLTPDQRDPLPQEDIFFRVLSVWGHTPPGVPIEAYVISAPPAIEWMTPIEASPERFEAQGGICGGGPEQCSTCNSFSQCTVNTRSPLGGGCECNFYNLCHDAFLTHGCCGETQGAGCDLASTCVGRCGVGCTTTLDCAIGGIAGSGVYSLDCAEHDRCKAFHGDILCNDELIRATDDCLFMAANCEGCPPCTNCPSYDLTLSAPTTTWSPISSSVQDDGCEMYRVNLTAGKQYTFKTGCGDGATANFDTLIDVFRPSGDCPNNFTWSNDDACESSRSRITLTAASSGYHYVKVRGYQGASGSFTLKYREDCVNGTPCNDGLYCTNPDTCQSGVCTGPARVCPGDQCNDGVCNESLDRCELRPKPNGTSCNDGLYCTNPDTCQSGVCTGPTRVCPGDQCNDGVCNESLDRCELRPKPNGTSCNDGLYCTNPDTCQSGVCTGPARVCPGDQCNDGLCNESFDRCELRPKPNGTPCEDGLFCDGAETCQAGICAGSGPACPGACCFEGCDLCADGSWPDSAAPLLYVASKESDSVTLFDATTGGRLASIVPAGYGGLDYANGIAISPYTGNLLVASVRTASVKEYEHSPGACEAVYKGNFVTSIVASGIAFGPDGYLYATDFNNDRVLRFNGETGAPDFPIFEAKGCGLDGPTGLTFSPDGSLLVGSQYTHNIVAYDTKTGAACCVVADGCGLDTPVGLALLPDNRLLVASFQTNSIVAFDLEAPDLSARCMPAFVEPGICGLSGPQGLALTSDGRLLVSSMHTDAVLQFDAATGAELAPCQLAQGCPLDGPTYLVATRGRESNVFHAWTFPYNAFIERPLYDCGTPLLKSDPVCDATLPKFQNNTARLTFAGPLGGRPTPGQVLIQQLLPSGGFGADLSTSFSFTVEPGNILRIQDNGNSLQNGRWYAVRNTGGWTGVGAFEVDYAVVVGDADNTGLSDFADLSFIFGNLTGAAADDDRNDVNADGFVDFADISDAFGFNGSFAPLKPTGHECRP